MILTDLTDIEKAVRKTVIPQIITLTSRHQALFSGQGGPPPTIETVELLEDFQPAAGLYLTVGDTASGKSVTTLALIALANAGGFPSVYLPIFEPRVPTYRFGAGENPRFEKPAAFMTDLKEGLGALAPQRQRRFVALDSITLPMKSYASTGGWEEQSTFPMGMQPSDRGFLDEISRIALLFNVTFFGVVSSALIPYVADLAGATEGLIVVRSPGVFDFQDRTIRSSRGLISVTLQPRIMAQAFHDFGYDAKNKNT